MAETGERGRTTTVGEILDRSKGTRSTHGSGLAAMNGRLGNDELLDRIEQGNASRDELLEFLVGRLEAMRTAQLAEIALTQKTNSEFLNHLGASEMQGIKPEPERWAEAARLYEQAARALCAGQLHRGGELVEQAVTADHKAFDDLGGLVRVDEAARAETPGALGDISADTACAECPEPEGVELAYEIQRVSNDGAQNIRVARRELDPWWTDLEEEEEEEEGAGG